jgi:hypothetical protein
MQINYVSICIHTHTVHINKFLVFANSPEGCEYSMYYGGKYLYITPDIFTGIMTGLFFVFVFFIGLGQLSAIQVCFYVCKANSKKNTSIMYVCMYVRICFKISMEVCTVCIQIFYLFVIRCNNLSLSIVVYYYRV